jgi:antitoxin YefM
VIVHTVPLSEAKARLTKLLKDVEELGEGVLITRSGRPAGVLLNVEDYEGLLETLEILADPALRRAVRKGLAEAKNGATLSHQEVWDGLDHPLHRHRG